MQIGLRALQPGDRAPDLALPAVNCHGIFSLADLRAKGRHLLIALTRPFSRRQMSMLASMKAQLNAEGTDVVLVVNTTPQRARAYLQLRTTQVLVLADPGHRAVPGRCSRHRAVDVRRDAGQPQSDGAHS